MVPTEKSPEVWIVLLNWNQCDLTGQCLRSLLQVSYPNLRLLLVDNGSQDGSVDKIRDEFGPRVAVIANLENLGFAEGNNTGIRHALDHGADYVMLLNNDTTVAPDFIDPLLQRFRLNPKAGVTTPKIFYMRPPNEPVGGGQEEIWAAGGEIDWWWGAGRCRGQGQVDRGQFDRAAQVDYAQGCCMLVPSGVWRTVGLLDSTFFIYFEDSDWSMRCRTAGLEVWVEPASVVWHVAGQAFASGGGQTSPGHRPKVFKPRAHFLHTRNGLWFFRRYGRGLQGAVCLVGFCAQALGFSVKLLFGGHAEAAQAVRQGLVNGWTGLPEPPTPIFQGAQST